MEHIGIDLGGSRSAVCVVSSEGTVLLERTIKTSEVERVVSKRATSRVAIESCAESRLVAIRVRERGHDVRVVPSVFVRSLGIGIHRALPRHEIRAGPTLRQQPRDLRLGKPLDGLGEQAILSCCSSDFR